MGAVRILPNSVTGEVHLPDDSDKSLVWDEDRKRWIDKNNPEEESAPPPPPPMMGQMPTASVPSALPNGTEAQSNASTAKPKPAAGYRRERGKNRRANMYKDAGVMGEKISVSNRMMPEKTNGYQPQQANFFMPTPEAPAGQTGSGDSSSQAHQAQANQPTTNTLAHPEQAPPASTQFFNPAQFGGPQMPVMPTQANAS